MTCIRSNISGIDFEFEPICGCKGEQIILVRAENLAFELVASNGKYKIGGEVPIWIRDLENDLGEVVNQLI